MNPLVDLYNLISMDTKLALGAHDLDKTEGNITLRLT
ncbi:phenylalanine--tRNA ligase beta subunit-related protein [Faecalibacillus faecis]